MLDNEKFVGFPQKKTYSRQGSYRSCGIWRQLHCSDMWARWMGWSNTTRNRLANTFLVQSLLLDNFSAKVDYILPATKMNIECCHYIFHCDNLEKAYS